MASSHSLSNASPPLANGDAPAIPAWLNEDHFVDVLEENVDGFKRILAFEAGQAGGDGENYASIILRVKIKVELDDSTTKDLSFMIKTVPQGEKGSMMAQQLNIFPKEQVFYETYIPEFEQMYRAVGKDVSFGPKFYKFKKNPGTEYILMEDLSTKGFKNLNRVDGFDQSHTESVLKLIAEFHAVSAVRYETKGEYDKSSMEGIHTEANRPFLMMMRQSLQVPLIESLARHTTTSKYVEKLKKLDSQIPDLQIKQAQHDPNEFYVLIHGDLWANNIMFHHDEEGKLDKTVLLDYQISRYSSPVVELYYLLMTSVKFELKLSHFDEFVKYYYDHLVENLKLLSYPKEVPTMKDLRLQLLKYSFWCVHFVIGVMVPILLDPSDLANFENYIEGGEKGKQLKMKLHNNPRFLKHIAAILPWMDTNGFLD